MDSFGRTTRIVISLMVVVFGAIYLAAGYIGSDVSAEMLQWRRLLQLLFAMLLGAVALLGIFKLIGKLFDYLVERQSRDDDDRNSSE